MLGLGWTTMDVSRDGLRVQSTKSPLEKVLLEALAPGDLYP